MSKRILTSFSDSPRHFELRLEAEILKNVVLPYVATALASIVLPVPGGPNISTPFQGLLIPLKYCGIRIGSNTASCRIFFASSSSAMSSKLTEGFLSITSL